MGVATVSLTERGRAFFPAAAAQGSFRLQLRAATTSGARYVGTVAAPGDPGYAATSVMLAQAGLSLAQDDLPDHAGVLTPAVAMGGALTARLRAAGFTLSAQAVD